MAIKIIDSFIFFNELDTLDIRLNILNEKVDTFVLVEATVSFTGKQKPLYYYENKHLFEKFNHKIIYHVVDDVPNSFEEVQSRLLNPKDELEKTILIRCLTTPNVPQDEVHWLREFYIKENINRALLNANLNDNDICFISDLDEIWNPELHISPNEYSIYKLKQHVFITFLNLRSNEYWAGTFYTRYKNIKNASINHLDTFIKIGYELIDNGGWHFTYQGGIDKIKTKLENFGHQECNTDEVKNLIQERLDNGLDVLGRPFKCIIDNESIPEYIKLHKNKYLHLFKQ